MGCEMWEVGDKGWHAHLVDRQRVRVALLVRARQHLLAHVLDRAVELVGLRADAAPLVVRLRRLVPVAPLLHQAREVGGDDGARRPLATKPPVKLFLCNVHNTPQRTSARNIGLTHYYTMCYNAGLNA